MNFPAANPITILALALLMVSASAQSGQQYLRWLDEQGGVHYGDVAPPGRKAETVQRSSQRADNSGSQSVTQGTPTKESDSASPEVPPDNDQYKGLDAKTRAFLLDLDARTKAAQEASEKADAERAESDKKCSAARQRKSYLQNNTARRLGTRQADGSIARMTQEEFEKRLQDTQDQIRKHCS